MEYVPEKCKRKRKVHWKIFDNFDESDESCCCCSDSETHLCPWQNREIKEGKPKITSVHQKHDYLTKLLEKKKLKDKSLSKKMKTPYDRKLDRSCWPIKLAKISKIKTKPREKKKKKPTQRSLTRKKFSNPTILSGSRKIREASSSVSYSESEVDDEIFKELYHYLNKNHFVYEPVTLEMLVDVLREPENLESGATFEKIIAKLRFKNNSNVNVNFDMPFRSTGALKLNLNPSPDRLRKEVMQKLHSGIILGLFVENNGYYKVTEDFKSSDLMRKKLIPFGRHCRCCRHRPKMMKSLLL